MDLKDFIADVPDFPKEGILFRDITPLLADAGAFKFACDQLSQFASEVKADLIVGPEARGFIFGCPVAVKNDIGFAPVRKPGKLPRAVETYEYDLEYGTDSLCLHKDVITPNMRVLIIDDLLATGGTALATAKLIEKLGGTVAGLACVVELDFLEGRKLLESYEVKSLVHY